MQAYSQVGVTYTPTILGPRLNSGYVSVYAQKLSAIAFVWLCSIVVWGHTANYASAIHPCGNTCRFQIIVAAAIWLFSSLLLLLNYLCERGSLSRTGLFSHSYESVFVGLLAFLWIPLLGAVSGVAGGGVGFAAPPLTVWFTWLGLVGAIYATFKAYHSSQEEKTQTIVPVVAEEGDFVIG